MDQLRFVAKKVDDYILSNIKGYPKELYDASLHYIIHGGKRLRPFITLKSSEIFNCREEVALPIASAIEITHNFTLIHDDIMDNDESRHGVATVHRAYSLPLAILAGDLLMVKAFHLIAKDSIEHGLDARLADRIVKRLAESCVEISEGQILDIKFANAKEFPSKDDYINMIRKKTGALFEVAAEAGAICSDADEEDIANLASYGMNLGVAFQLIDDLIGVAGDPIQTKKPVGNDIREGKKTLPILLAINKADSKDDIVKVFGNKKASNEQIRNAVNAIINAGIDEEVRLEARNYANKALDKIKGYDDAYPLIALAEFVVERTL